MMSEPHRPPEPISNRDSERGAALIMALLVSVILVFLGMGLLLQTSLGLQASGTDRWVAKAMYAADAGVMLQIQMIQSGALGSPASFVLQDSPDLDGFLKGEYTVTVSEFCEIRPATDLWSRIRCVRPNTLSATFTFAAMRCGPSATSGA